MATSKSKKKAAKKSTKKATSKKATNNKKANIKKKSSPKKLTKTKPVIKAVKKTVSINKNSSKDKLPLNFKPLHDHILVRQDGESDRTPGGLYIPAIAQDKPAKGTVLAIGTGVRNKKGKIKPLDVQVGEQIVYSPHGGSKVTFGGKDFVILKEEEVLGVLKD